MTFDLFLSVTCKEWKESIGFPHAELNAESFEKKSLRKSNVLETHQTLKILVVGSSSHIIYFRFLSISGHLRTTQDNQNLYIRRRRISCNWGKNLSIISKGKIFRSDRKKNSFIVNYWRNGVSSYIYSTILVITKIYMFLLLYLFCY